MKKLIFLVTAVFFLGFLLFSQSDLKIPRKEDLLKKLSEEPSSAVANYNAGSKYYSDGEYFQSYLLFLRGVSENDDSSGSSDQLFLAFADSLYKLGLLKESLYYYKLAMQENPLNAQAAENYLIALERLSRHENVEGGGESVPKPNSQKNSDQEDENKSGDEDKNDSDNGNINNQDEEKQDNDENDKNKENPDNEIDKNRQNQNPESKNEDTSDKQQQSEEKKQDIPRVELEQLFRDTNTSDSESLNSVLITIGGGQQQYENNPLP